MSILLRLVTGCLAIATLVGCAPDPASRLKGEAETYLKEEMQRLETKSSGGLYPDSFGTGEFKASDGYSGIASYTRMTYSKKGTIGAACLDLTIVGTSGIVAVYRIATTNPTAVAEGDCMSWVVEQ